MRYPRCSGVSIGLTRGRVCALSAFTLGLCFFCGSVPVWSQTAETRRCIVEVYFDGERQDSPADNENISRWLDEHPGVLLVARDVQRSENAQRIESIARYYKSDKDALPIVYGCNRVFTRVGAADEFQQRLNELVRVEVFVRQGCSRCARAKQFLARVEANYPGFEFVYRDLVTNRQAVADLNELVRRHGQAAASVPVIHGCNQLLVGWDRDETSGARLLKVLDTWTTLVKSDGDKEDRPTQSRQAAAEEGPSNLIAFLSPHWRASQFERAGILAGPQLALIGSLQVESPQQDQQSTQSDGGLPLPSLPIPGVDDSELKGRPPPTNLSPNSGEESGGESISSFRMELPWLGTVDAHQLGLPLFTLTVGLVDGFNPCAMWVLLFLLSLLVNLHSRSRILAVAGSFVLISGIAYFLFMAAWLNVFLLVGLLRPVQIALGLIGIAIGLVHVKDYFAFKKGVSLSIPERAKPGIYAQTRKILTAENLIAAIVAASILAVMVNIVELLCTAGLPALYTEVLANHHLAAWQNYAFLGLYIVAYMFDDSLMVGIVVVTLSKRKLQEGQGRWLKLISGVVIIVIGLLMLIKPDWLM